MDLEQVFDDLVRFETRMWNGIDAELLEECGISLATLNQLLVIDEHDQCRVQDIATALAITVGGASQAIDRLQRRGLCERVEHPADRRSNLLRLTDEGQAALEAARPRFQRQLHRWFTAEVSPQALESFATVLRVLRTSHGMPRGTSG